MAELKLVVGADVKEAEQALRSLVTNLNQTTAAVQKFSTDVSAFGKLPLHSIDNIRKAFLELKQDLSNVKFAAIPPVTANIKPAQDALKILTDDVRKTTLSVGTISASFDRFSKDVNKSLGTLSTSSLTNFKKVFIDFKSDLSNVKISALPPVGINIKPAQDSLKILTTNVDETIDAVKADLKNIKVSALPPIKADVGPAQVALRNLAEEAQRTGIAVTSTGTSVERFKVNISKSLGALPLHNVEAFRKSFLNFKADLSNIKVAAIPPIRVDVSLAQQSLIKLSQEAERTGVSVSNVGASFQRFSANVSRSFGALPLSSIAAFRDAFQKFKSDLTNVKITAIPPIRVDTTQAQQSLQTLTEESRKSSSSVSNLSAAYARWSTMAASSSGTAAKSLKDVNSSLSVIGNTAKTNFGAIVVSMDQTSASVRRFGVEVNKSLGTLPLHNVAEFRQSFLDFKNDISNAKISAIPPITADIRPAQQSLKTLTAEVEKSGAVAQGVSGVYTKWATEVASSSTKAVKSLKDVNEGTAGIESSSKKSLNSVSASISKIPPATRPAITAVSKLGDTLETLRGKLLARQSFLVTEKDIGRIAVINREIRELQQEILRVKSIGSTGFDSLGNAVVKTGGSFNALSAGASKGFTALRSLAQIIPGIGIAGLIGVATQAVAGLFSMGRAAEETTQKLKELIIPLENIRDAAIGGTQDELSKVSALSNAILDQNKSYKERNAALIQLKQINESYFGDLTLEAAKLGILKDRVDEYTKAIINQAVIKAFSENIGKVAVELATQEKEFNKAGAAVKQYTETVDAANKATESQRALTPFGVSPAVGVPQIKLLDKAKDKFKEQAEVVGKLRNQMFELRTAIQEAVNTSLDFRPLEIPKVKGAAQAGDDLQKFINKAKQLNAELEKIGFIAPVRFSFFDTFQQELEKARKVFDDFNNNKLKLNPKIFFFPSFSEPQIRERVEDAMSVVDKAIKEGFIKLPGLEIEATISPNFAANAKKIATEDFTKAFKDIGKALPPVDLEATAGFNFGVAIDSLRKFFNAADNITKQGLETMAADFRKGIDQINSIIVGISIEGLSTIGEAIGAALAGGDVSEVFKKFGNIVADGLSAIGKQMIAMSPVIQAIKAALASGGLNPAVLLAGGISLIAIAAALRAALNKGVKGFAEGGLVFGPTMGLIGEGVGTSRSNPEVIAPLDQLKRMIGEVGPGSLQVVVVGRLRGKDQILQNARTSKSQRRLG